MLFVAEDSKVWYCVWYHLLFLAPNKALKFMPNLYLLVPDLKISGTNYKRQYKYRYKYMHIPL